MSIDLSKAAWLLVGGRWTEAPPDPPEPRIEGRYEGYGCDTGCMGYRFYYMPEDDAISYADGGDFEFGGDSAVERASALSARHGRPVLLERETDGW